MSSSKHSTRLRPVLILLGTCRCSTTDSPSSCHLFCGPFQHITSPDVHGRHARFAPEPGLGFRSISTVQPQMPQKCSVAVFVKQNHQQVGRAKQSVFEPCVVCCVLFVVRCSLFVCLLFRCFAVSLLFNACDVTTQLPPDAPSPGRDQEYLHAGPHSPTHHVPERAQGPPT